MTDSGEGGENWLRPSALIIPRAGDGAAKTRYSRVITTEREGGRMWKFLIIQEGGLDAVRGRAGAHKGLLLLLLFLHMVCKLYLLK